MPFTPFHFGPGALLHAVAPRHVSFLSFVAANVVIDFESLYNLVLDRRPVHAFLHTYIGATLIVAVVIGAFLGCRWFAERYWFPNILGWRELTTSQVIVGAALGAMTHVVFDSIMHPDMRPLSPFSEGNALLGVVSLGVLHRGCVLAGAAALMIVLARWWLARRDSASESTTGTPSEGPPRPF